MLRQIDAAADVDRLSRDVAAIGAGEMPDHAGYVGWLAAARGQDRAGLAMHGLFAVALGFDQTGRHEIDGDLARRQLHGERFGHAVEPGFGGDDMHAMSGAGIGGQAAYIDADALAPS